MATADVWGVLLIDSDGGWRIGGASDCKPETIVQEWHLAGDIGCYARQFVFRAEVEIPKPTPPQLVAEALTWVDFDAADDLVLRLESLGDDELRAAMSYIAKLRGLSTQAR